MTRPTGDHFPASRRRLAEAKFSHNSGVARILALGLQ
jgi:hypothetical protein